MRTNHQISEKFVRGKQMKQKSDEQLIKEVEEAIEEMKIAFNF